MLEQQEHQPGPERPDRARRGGREAAAEAERECTLAGGDDYELLFTVPPGAVDAACAAAARVGLAVTRIGHINPSPGLHLRDAQGRSLAQTHTGFDHFLP